MARVKAEDVVRRYLNGLLEGRFNKRSLAPAMGTSRSSLDAALESGSITIGHVNGIADHTGGRVSAVFEELAGIAKRMEREKHADSETPPAKTPEEHGELPPDLERVPGTKRSTWWKSPKQEAIPPSQKADEEGKAEGEGPPSPRTRRHK